MVDAMRSLTVSERLAQRGDSLVHLARRRQERHEADVSVWPKLVATFPAYDLYQRNSKGRKLPVVILDPR
jgi:hypothetical protein